MFLGDSITREGDKTVGYVDVVRAALTAAHPDGGVEVFGAGIAGNKVPDLENHLDRDVLEKRPPTVVVYIGINDIWHSIRNQGTPKQAFDKRLHSLMERIRSTGARAILCTPSVIGERRAGDNPLDAMLDDYAAITQTMTADLKTGLIDLRKAFVAHQADANTADVAKGVLTKDGVHLNAVGERFVADRMLEGLTVGPAIVTDPGQVSSKPSPP